MWGAMMHWCRRWQSCNSHIFVLGTDLFPYSKEGRAAFYVAATRAKLRLYVTGLWRDRSLLVEAQGLRQAVVE